MGVNIRVQHRICEHLANVHYTWAMTVANTFAVVCARHTAAMVLQSLALPSRLVENATTIHVFAMMRYKHCGRHTEIFAFFLCIAVVTSTDIRETTILIVDAIPRNWL